MKTNQKTNEKSGNKSKGCKYSGSDKEHKVAWSWDDSGGSWLFDDLGCCVCAPYGDIPDSRNYNCVLRLVFAECKRRR